MNLSELAAAAHSKWGGSTEFVWDCWGANAQYLEIRSPDELIGSCVFDRESGLVYAVELFDTQDRVAWRWLDPVFRSAWVKEAKIRSVDTRFAWDNVAFQEISETQILIILDRMSCDPT